MQIVTVEQFERGLDFDNFCREFHKEEKYDDSLNIYERCLYMYTLAYDFFSSCKKLSSDEPTKANTNKALSSIGADKKDADLLIKMDIIHTNPLSEDAVEAMQAYISISPKQV